MRKSVTGVLLTMGCALVAAFAVPGCVQAYESAEFNESRQSQFISTVGNAAKPSQEEYGVPASVTIAQAILESGWGESELSREANNFFGMKCHDKDPGDIAVDCVEINTSECDKDDCWKTKDWFRVYDSRADSFSDHGQTLHSKSRYDKAFDNTDDPDEFIREVHKAGYATDPKYSDKIIKLMERYDLYRFNE